MATDNHDGIGIHPSPRERDIPNVDVKLLPTATMLDGVSSTGKDVMTVIWGTEGRIGYGTESVSAENGSRSINFSRRASTPSNTAPDITKIYGVSLSKELTAGGGYELPTLIYLSNAMILNPYLVPVNSYLTKNATYTINDSSGSNSVAGYDNIVIHGSAEDKPQGSTGTADNAPVAASTTPGVSDPNVGAVSFTPEAIHLTDGQYQEDVRKVQQSQQSGAIARKSIIRVSKLVPAAPVYKDFYSSLISTFSLKKNQPFAVSLSMFEPPPTWLKALSEQEITLFGDPTKEGSQGSVPALYAISPSLRKNTVTFIEWASYILVVYQKRGKIELYQKEVQQVSGVTSPDDGKKKKKQDGPANGKNSNKAEQEKQQAANNSIGTRTKLGERNISKSADSSQDNFLSLNLAVYPIGNSIVVTDGEDGLRAGVKASRHDTQAIFNLNHVVDAAPGPVKITTYLGSAAYSYLQLLHIGTGLFTSPTVQLLPKGTQATTPILTVDYEGRIGAGALTSSQNQKFTLPEGEDTFYDFLSDCSLDAKIDESNGSTHYELVLTSNANSEKEFDRIYSPRVYKIQARLRPRTVTVNMDPDPQIDNTDVIKIDVDMASEGSSATVVLNNRNLDHCPPRAGGKYLQAGFVGVKPIQIKYGITGDGALSTRFTGYITNRSFSLGGKGTKPTVTLHCEDVSIKAKNTYAVNLPIFDGWCQLGAFYYLAKEAGYSDDEIVFDRHGNTKLTSLLQGDIENMTGGCFAGHAGGIVQQSEVLHAPLPMPAHKEQPYYMFSMGTTIWNCMQEIRKFSGFYLFPNHLGQLVYAQPDTVFSGSLSSAVSGYGSNSGGSSGAFIEQGGQKIGASNTARFAEVQNLLSVKHEPIRSKNHVVIIGYTFGGKESSVPIGNPFFEVQSDKDWPNNVTNPNYIPWKAVTILREPHWNDSARIAFIAAETFRRSNRPFMYASWSSFGQAAILPYDEVTIDESLSAETGITGQNIVVTSVRDSLDANTMSFFSSYEGEILTLPNFNFHPSHNSAYTVDG